MTDQRSENSPETESENQPAAPEGGAADEIAELRAQVERQGKRIDEVTRAYAEALNDRESFRARVERDRERQVEAARAEVASALLDAIDDLRRALSNATGADAAGVIEGVQMIADGLHRRVEGMGLSPVPTMGQPFDPNLHEAVDLVAVSNQEEDGRVVEEVRGGWRAGDRVIRAARVRVGRFVPNANA